MTITRLAELNDAENHLITDGEEVIGWMALAS